MHRSCKLTQAPSWKASPRLPIRQVEALMRLTWTATGRTLSGSLMFRIL